MVESSESKTLILESYFQDIYEAIRRFSLDHAGYEISPNPTKTTSKIFSSKILPLPPKID